MRVVPPRATAAAAAAAASSGNSSSSSGNRRQQERDKNKETSFFDKHTHTAHQHLAEHRDSSPYIRCFWQCSLPSPYRHLLAPVMVPPAGARNSSLRVNTTLAPSGRLRSRPSIKSSGGPPTTAFTELFAPPSVPLPAEGLGSRRPPSLSELASGPLSRAPWDGGAASSLERCERLCFEKYRQSIVMRSVIFCASTICDTSSRLCIPVKTFVYFFWYTFF